MAGENQSKPLSYESPRDRVYRERHFRKLIPDTRLGLIACWICGVAMASAALGVSFALMHLELVATIFGGIAGTATLACIAVGFPLACGGLADEGHRKRFAIIGLLGIFGWLGGCLLFFIWAVAHMR